MLIQNMNGFFDAPLLVVGLESEMPKPVPYIEIRSPLFVLMFLLGSRNSSLGGEYVNEFVSAPDDSLETVNRTGTFAPKPGATLHRKRV
jgi:hypothetical protein